MVARGSLLFSELLPLAHGDTLAEISVWSRYGKIRVLIFQIVNLKKVLLKNENDRLLWTKCVPF